MNDRELIQKAVNEKIFNRKDIRDRAIAMAEARLRTDPMRSAGVSLSDKLRTSAHVVGIDHNNKPAGKPLKSRKLILTVNLLLLVLVIVLIGATTQKYWLPADGTTVQTTVSTTEANVTTNATTESTRTTGTLAGEPNTLTIAKGSIGEFQQKLWEAAGDPLAPFPEYYAGAYFEYPSTFKGFTVLVTCDPSLVELTLQQAADQSRGKLPFSLTPMTVVKVEHSYNELLFQYNAIVQLMSKQPESLSTADQELLKKISKVGIDEKLNEVYVEVPTGTLGISEALNRALIYVNNYEDAHSLVRVYEMKDIPASEEVDAIFHEFLVSHDIKMSLNGGMGSNNLHLPDSFEAIEDGYPIGEFLRQRNERSILNGLDFSGYLGKDIILIGSGLASVGGESKEINENVFVLIADGKVVGYWFDDGQLEAELQIQDFLIMSKYLEGGFQKYTR